MNKACLLLSFVSCSLLPGFECMTSLFPSLVYIDDIQALLSHDAPNNNKFIIHNKKRYIKFLN